MALKAAFPSMTSTKEMKFYSSPSVTSEEDPTSDETFQLRISEDEDSPNTEDGEKSQSSVSKETEDDILDKYKFDELVDNEIAISEEKLLSDIEDDTDKEKPKNTEGEVGSDKTNNVSNVDNSKDDCDTNKFEGEYLSCDEKKSDELQNKSEENVEASSEKNENSKKEMEISKEEKPPEIKNTICESILTENLQNTGKTESVTPSENEEDAKENANEHKNDKEIVDDNKKNDNDEKKHAQKTDDDDKEVDIEKKNDNEEKQKGDKKSGRKNKDEKDESNKNETEQKELFKRQTMDTENLLDILDVKSADENILLEELKEASSSENSEKDENEEDCEDLDKVEGMEFEENDDKVEEDTEDNDVDEAMDTIDIEENILEREETGCDVMDSTSDVRSPETGDSDKTKERTENEKSDSADEIRENIELVSDKEPATVLSIDNSVSCSESTLTSEVNTETNIIDKQTDDENKSENGTKETTGLVPKSIKRSLTEAEIDLSSKRIKVIEKGDFYDKPSLETIENKEKKPAKNVESLNCLVEFMKSNVLTKLSRNNLEQLCLQKMCEAVMDKSEIGELRHQLKVQEQMLEHWRKEVTQLTKQARDLETVNNRLMSDYRLRNERDKPIMPLKITRSVGLQVNPENFLPVNRRKNNRSSSTSSSQSNATSTTSSSVNQTVNQPNVLPNVVNSLPKDGATLTDCSRDESTLSTSSSFIDLTDEDDKKSNTVRKRSSGNGIVTVATGGGGGTITTITQNNKTSAGVVAPTSSPSKSFRIVSPAVASGVAGTTRLMYVVNSPVQSILSTTTPPTQKPQPIIKVKTNGLVGQSNNVRTTNVLRTQPSLRQIQTIRTSASSKVTPNNSKTVSRHPAPLPPTPVAQVSIGSRKPVPPKPHLQIRKNGSGIVLSWKMPYNLNNFESIASYQLYAYQETSAAPNTDMWRKVGDIKALALPMACTLTQFADGNKYHFAVRAVDVLKRVGPFSDPGPILL